MTHSRGILQILGLVSSARDRVVSRREREREKHAALSWEVCLFYDPLPRVARPLIRHHRTQWLDVFRRSDQTVVETVAHRGVVQGNKHRRVRIHLATRQDGTNSCALFCSHGRGRKKLLPRPFHRKREKFKYIFASEFPEN